jgi:hypothetical protein
MRVVEADDETPPPLELALLLIVSIRSSRDETAWIDTVIFGFLFSGSSSLSVHFRIDSGGS